MTLKRRINRLEHEAGAGDELPYLSLTQSLDDDMLYVNESKGIKVRRDSDEFAELAATHRIIILSWAESWPGGQEPEDYKPPADDPNVIVLSWGDDD